MAHKKKKKCGFEYYEMKKKMELFVCFLVPDIRQTIPCGKSNSTDKHTCLRGASTPEISEIDTLP